MKKIILFFLLIIIMTLTLFYFLKPSSTVIINNYKLTLQKATTPLERMKGLSFRKSLNEDQGMLFIYPREDYLSFWMIDMNFPLDIIWLDKDCKVVYIEKNIQPCSSRIKCSAVTPNKPAQFVLEVVSGFSEKHQVFIGNNLEVCRI